MKDEKEAVQVNKVHWESVRDMHLKSEYYMVENLANLEPNISEAEMKDLGNINGWKGAHLQCGFGLDTITLSRLGATMTGFDISSASIVEARNIASRCNTTVSFVESDVYQIDPSYFAKFDFVYTSHGVLRWLPDLNAWATTISRLLRPGGMFYIFEIHPLVYFVDQVATDGICLSGEYFDQGIKFKQIGTSHAGHVDENCASEVAHTNWSMKNIFQSVLTAGLTIHQYNEFPGCSYNRKNLFPVRHDNLWYPVTTPLAIPLSFSIKAFKEVKK